MHIAGRMCAALNVETKEICDFPTLYFVFQFTSWSNELAAISSLLHECKGYTLNIGIEPKDRRPEGECQYYDV